VGHASRRPSHPARGFPSPTRVHLLSFSFFPLITFSSTYMCIYLQTQNSYTTMHGENGIQFNFHKHIEREAWSFDFGPFHLPPAAPAKGGFILFLNTFSCFFSLFFIISSLAYIWKPHLSFSIHSHK